MPFLRSHLSVLFVTNSRGQNAFDNLNSRLLGWFVATAFNFLGVGRPTPRTKKLVDCANKFYIRAKDRLSTTPWAAFSTGLESRGYSEMANITVMIGYLLRTIAQTISALTPTANFFIRIFVNEKFFPRWTKF